MKRLLRLLRTARNRVLGLFSGRAGGLQFETDFWDDYFRSQGGKWPEDYRRRLDPSSPLESMHRPFIDRLPNQTVQILDVGAGPLTILGKVHPSKTVQITAVDPLAARYDALLKKYAVAPPIRTRLGSGEALVSQFGENTFDFVYAQNCIDHAENPVEAMRQMVRVARPDCDAVLYHAPNEAETQAYSGLHQWNFTLEHDRFIVTGRHGKTDVAVALKDIGVCTARLHEGWILTIIHKYPGASLGSSQTKSSAI
jgi:SAM-dependent methyltransferase